MMTTIPAPPQQELERSTELKEVQFRLSLLRLTGQQSEPLENLLTEFQAAA